MRRLSTERRCQIVALLNDGLSIRATERATGVGKAAISRLMLDIGAVCAAEHDRRVRNLQCRYVQVDELWSFCGMKAKRIPADQRDTFGIGDVWTFTSIDTETKLLPAWLIGRRNTKTATRFLIDLGRRIPQTFQLSTDAAAFYRDAVWTAFGEDIDFGMIWKHSVPDKDEARKVPKIERTPIVVNGNPETDRINTSYVERHNLTMRRSMRRYTRRTNAHSKRVRNMAAAVATYTFFYNFVRPHGTLVDEANGRPTTPAMAAGLAERPWSMAQMIGLLEACEDSAADVAMRRHDRRLAA